MTAEKNVVILRPSPHIGRYWGGSGVAPFPLWSAYAAATLRKKGWSPILIDSWAKPVRPMDIRDTIRAKSRDMVVIEADFFNLLQMGRLIRYLRLNFGNHCKLIAIGPSIGARSDALLQPVGGFDAAVTGIPGTSLADLCECINKGERFEESRGVCWYEPLTGLAQYGGDFSGDEGDGIQPAEMHRELSRMVYGPAASNMGLSLGMPCGTIRRDWWSNHRPEQLARLATDLVQRYRLRMLEWADKEFLDDPAYTHGLLTVLAGQPEKFPWLAYTRSASVEAATIDLLRKAGCRALQINLPSEPDMATPDRLAGLSEMISLLGDRGILSFIGWPVSGDAKCDIQPGELFKAVIPFMKQGALVDFQPKDIDSIAPAWDLQRRATLTFLKGQIVSRRSEVFKDLGGVDGMKRQLRRLLVPLDGFPPIFPMW